MRRRDSPLGAHFDALTHPQFWSTLDAQSNVENFGSTLAMTVLDRVSFNTMMDAIR